MCLLSFRFRWRGEMALPVMHRETWGSSAGERLGVRQSQDW